MPLRLTEQPAIKLVRTIPVLLLLLIFSFSGAAQDLNQKISLEVKDATLEDVLKTLSKDHQVPLFYSNDLEGLDTKVSLQANNDRLEEVLQRLFYSAGLAYKLTGGQIVVKPRAEVANKTGWIFPEAPPKQQFTISGYVRDETSGEELPGAVVRVKNQSEGTITNPYGYYSMTLPQGQYELEYSYLGFVRQIVPLKLFSNQRIDRKLPPETFGLSIVEVEGSTDLMDDREDELRQLPLQQIKEIPPLLGNRDVIQGVQHIPGIQSKTEGSTGFFVRGGNHDQNLILLDEAPVYNEAHFLGFVSIFNWNTLKSAEIYKDGIPAQYGGRLSSVMDIRMKEGNMNKWGGNAEINPMFGQVTLEGPLIKEKASILVSGRRSAVDVLLGPESLEEIDIKSLFFFDLNGKINYRIGKNDRIYLSGYIGEDLFAPTTGEVVEQRWGNQTATLRWNHVYGDKLFSNTSLIYSNYYFLSTEEVDQQEYFLVQSITDATAKTDFNYYPNPKHSIRFGAYYTRHFLTPGYENFEEVDTNFSYSLPEALGIDYGVYISDEYQIAPNLKLMAGLRYSIFDLAGDGETFIIDEDSDEIVDTVINNGEVYQTYHGPEPRFKLTLSPDSNYRVFLSYDRTRQYLSLASNTITKAPADIWIPVSNNIRPQIADQVSIGSMRLFSEGRYQTVISAYYKELTNAIDFRERANLVVKEQIEAEVRQGRGFSYGLEVQLTKATGKLTGTISYTLSRSRLDIEGINNDESYPASYDRRHDLSAWARYRWKPRWSFSGNFVLASGLPTNFPVASYTLQGQEYVAYGSKNGDRLPIYHRLDLAVEWTGNPEKRWRGDWTFSVYNVYNRYNAYTLVFKKDNPNAQNRDTVQQFYIFPIVPSLSYRLSF